jgi:dihydrofolate reductase
VRGDLADEIGKLKEQPDKNIQIPGTPTLVRSLLCHGLLDELSIGEAPIVSPMSPERPFRLPM